MSKERPLTRSYLHAPGKLPFIGRTIGEQLYIVADKYRDKEMYVFYADNERISFNDMKDKSQQLSASFLSKGFKKGDRIAKLGANHSEWLITLMACAQLGILLMQLRLEFPLASVRLLLKKYRCKALVLTRSPSDLLDRICSEVLPKLTEQDKDNVNLESHPDLEYVITGGDSTSARGINTFSDFSLIGTEADREKVEDICWRIDTDDPCMVFFTSGTTGEPKGAVHNHHTFLNSINYASNYRNDVDGFDPQWETLRYGTTMTFAGTACYIGMGLPLVRGTTTVVVYPTFDVHLMARALQEEKVTEAFFFVHHISDLLNLPDINKYQLSLRVACLSGSTIPPALRQKVKNICKYVTNCYGMTETFGSHFNHPLDPPYVIENAAVYPIGGGEVKIVDTDQNIVPLNAMGELHFRGFSVLMHYLQDEEKTKQVKDTNGWLRTGDLAKMDENGYITMLGRLKDIIIKQAVNLSPMELEAVLYKHPDVLQALVAGVPDERCGEEICAAVVLRPGCSSTESDIREYCKDKVYSLLEPKYVLFVNKLPTTETGKFSRVQMTKMAMSKLNLQDIKVQ